MSSKIKKRPTYTDDFKRQLVALHSHGKRKVDLVREYGISPAALDRWVKQANQTGSFKTKDNLTLEQLEIRQLKKKLKQAEMENDILKQAALIFARKDNS
jgi:transposase